MTKSGSKTKIVTLTINGAVQEIEASTSLNQFLRACGVDIKFVAVAYNRTVLRREEFEQITLSDGDVVEIVRPVGGG